MVRFLWAVCQLQQIKTLKLWTNNNIEKTLRDLPKTLEETYCRILLGIDRIYHRPAKAVLQWLISTEAPMKLRELVEICITTVDHKPYVQEGDREAMEAIVDVLSALVEVNEVHQPGGYDEGPQVVLAHLSVKEYLTSDRIRQSPVSSFALDTSSTAYDRAQCCLAYVIHVEDYCRSSMSFQPKMDNPRTTKSWIDHNQEKLQQKYPFYMLAASQWFLLQRQREVEVLEPPKPGLELTLLRNDRSFYTWYLLLNNLDWKMCDVYPFKKWRPNQEDCSTWAMRRACLLRLPGTLARMCHQSPTEIDAAKNIPHGTLLMSASINGFQDMVDVLLDAGANANLSTDCGSPLYAACQSKSLGTVQSLLRAGADTNSKPYPLCVACLDNNVAVVDCLLDAGADPNLWTDQGYILYIACRSGEFETVESLLSGGADPNIAFALHFAATHHMSTLIEILLKYRVDVNLRTPRSAKTPLHAALESHTSCDHRGINGNGWESLMLTLRLLLNAGADAGALPPMCIWSEPAAILLREHGATNIYPPRCTSSQLSVGFDQMEHDESDQLIPSLRPSGKHLEGFCQSEFALYVRDIFGVDYETESDKE